MTGLEDCNFEIYITIQLSITGLTDCNFPNPVIPTEKPLGFDEESTVCTSKSSESQSTHWRSSRRFAPQDDEFGGLVTPLRMTGLGIAISFILSFRQRNH